MQLSKADKSPQVAALLARATHIPRNVSEGQLEMVFVFDNVHQMKSCTFSLRGGSAKLKLLLS